MRYLRALLNAFPETCAVLLDTDGRCVHSSNNLFGDLVRYKFLTTPKPGVHFREFVRPSWLPRFEGLYHLALAGKTSSTEYKLGQSYFEKTASPLLDQNEVIGVLSLYRDVTTTHNALDKLRAKATHDSLTGLHKRSVLQDFTVALIQKKDAFGVIFFDLDDFKHVNDTYGHAAGDELLCLVSKAIQSQIRSGDLAVRMGGDEFVAVVRTEAVQDTAARIVREVNKVCLPFGSSCSYGTSSYPEHGNTLQALLQYADMSMYYVKGQKNLSLLG